MSQIGSPAWLLLEGEFIYKEKKQLNRRANSMPFWQLAFPPQEMLTRPCRKFPIDSNEGEKEVEGKSCEGRRERRRLIYLYLIDDINLDGQGNEEEQVYWLCNYELLFYLV